MGFLDHLFDGFGPTAGGAPKFLRGNLKTAERLLADGERGTAQIVGIRIETHIDEADDYEYALRLDAERTVGCRQRLGPLLEDIRLGQEVPIRHDGGDRALIDTPAMGSEADGAWGYKALGDPPGAGIEDDRFQLAKERRKAAAATATILSLEPFTLMGMRTESFAVTVRVEVPGEAPYETALKRELIPFYAAHLAEPGTELPALVRPDRPDKVRIDWPAAAVADPGVGRPAAAAFAAARAAEEEAARRPVAGAAPAQDWSEQGLAADDFGDVDGVDFDTWVAVEAGLVRDRVKPADYDAYAQRLGVAPGGWAAVQSGWQGRMMSDPRVGTRFGSAYQAAVKRRR